MLAQPAINTAAKMRTYNFTVVPFRLNVLKHSNRNLSESLSLRGFSLESGVKLWLLRYFSSPANA